MGDDEVTVRRYAASDHDAVLALASELTVGVLGVGEKRHFAGDRDAYIGELAVAPAARRRGVARALVAAAQDWAVDRGLAHLTLDTGAANDAALAFYRSLGFVTEQVMLSRPVS